MHKRTNIERRTLKSILDGKVKMDDEFIEVIFCNG